MMSSRSSRLKPLRRRKRCARRDALASSRVIAVCGVVYSSVTPGFARRAACSPISLSTKRTVADALILRPSSVSRIFFSHASASSFTGSIFAPDQVRVLRSEPLHFLEYLLHLFLVLLILGLQDVLVPLASEHDADAQYHE